MIQTRVQLLIFFSCKHHFSGITQLFSHAMIYVVHSIITVYLSSQFSPLNTCTFVLILSCIHTFFGQAQKNDFHLSSLLLQESFLLQALGLLRWWGTRKTEEHFHWIVDEPLQRRQSTDHDDTWAETLPQTCGNKKKNYNKNYINILLHKEIKSRLHWFCYTPLHDWSRKLSSPSSWPITSQTKTCSITLSRA